MQINNNFWSLIWVLDSTYACGCFVVKFVVKKIYKSSSGSKRDKEGKIILLLLLPWAVAYSWISWYKTQYPQTYVPRSLFGFIGNMRPQGSACVQPCDPDKVQARSGFGWVMAGWWPHAHHQTTTCFSWPSCRVETHAPRKTPWHSAAWGTHLPQGGFWECRLSPSEADGQSHFC